MLMADFIYDPSIRGSDTIARLVTFEFARVVVEGAKAAANIFDAFVIAHLRKELGALDFGLLFARCSIGVV